MQDKWQYDRISHTELVSLFTQARTDHPARKDFVLASKKSNRLREVPDKRHGVFYDKIVHRNSGTFTIVHRGKMAMSQRSLRAGARPAGSRGI